MQFTRISVTYLQNVTANTLIRVFYLYHTRNCGGWGAPVLKWPLS